MKNLFFVLFTLYIICNEFISNENICELPKTDRSFTGVKLSQKWVDISDDKEIQIKSFIYTNSKEWVFELSSIRTECIRLQLIEGIDKNLINKFGLKSIKLLKDFIDCNIFYKVLINSSDYYFLFNYLFIYMLS